MKIKPLEKNENKLIKIKLAFLFSLIITVLIISFFIKKPTKENLPKKENVLGVENNHQALNFSKIEEDFGQVGQQTLSETTNFLNQTTAKIASQASSTISSLIYDTAVKPIVDQFQRLPKEQQEKVKERICR